MIVFIPTLNRQPQLLEALPQWLAAYERVIVIDNGRSDALRGPQRPRGVSVVTPPFNIGVAGAWNYALRIAADCSPAEHPVDDWCVIANDDITLAEDSAARLRAAIPTDAESRVVVVGGHPTEPWSFFAIDAGRVLAEIGEFDQQFWPGYYEDNDYEARLARADRDMAVVATGARHVSHGTEQAMTDAARERLRTRYAVSTRLYQAKWGGQPPRGELYEAPYDPRVLRGCK